MSLPGSDRSSTRNPSHCHRSVRISVRAITELPVRVPAPAFDRGIRKQRTRMVAPGSDLCRRSGRQVVAGDFGWAQRS